MWEKFIATTKSYKEFVIEQLDFLENITCRPMMGEYLLYYNHILFGGIYDNQVLIKIVESNKKYNLPQAIPYKGAKAMYKMESLDDQKEIRKIIQDTCLDLKRVHKK